MKNRYKIWGIFLVLLMISIISFQVSASNIPDGLTKIDDTNLAKIQGMGQQFSIEQINSSEFGFSYSGNKDNAFQHASGMMNITNVSGNDNIINNIIDLELNIYNLDGVTNLDFDHLKSTLDLD